MTPIDDVRLRAIEQRIEAATRAFPTPWTGYFETRQGLGGSSFVAAGPEEDEREIYAEIFEGTKAIRSPDPRLDAFLDFVAEAITDLPDLIAEIRRLRGAERK